MACAAGSRLASTNKTGLNGNQWLKELTVNLGGDYTKFALQIGFSEAQVQLIEGTGDRVHQLLTEKWLFTIGRHTTKYEHIIYTALVTLNRQDLLDTYYRKGAPSKHSEDIWDDFLTELHAIDVVNLESKEKDKKPDVKRKKKMKNTKKTKEEKLSDVGVKSEVYKKDVDNKIVGDNETLRDDNVILPNSDVESMAEEAERDNVELGDDSSLSDDSRILPTTDMQQHPVMNVIAEDVVIGDQIIVDRSSRPSEDMQQRPVINIYAEDVVVGEKGQIIVDKRSRDSQDDKEEITRKELSDIILSKGAGGSKSKKNKVKLQILESCFRQRNCGKHFESIYGKGLLTYLHQSTDYFTLTKQSSQWFVHINSDTTPKECTQTQSSKETSKMSLSKTKKDHRAKKTLSNQTLIRPIHDHKKESSYIPNKCTKFGDFLDMVGRFRDGHYLLMISKMDYIKHEEALTNIPWLCVFDCDERSFTEGLFYRIEDILRAKRGAVYPCTWKEPPNIQAFGTEWCFISGSAHVPGSSTPGNFKMWYSHIQASFEKHIKDMTQLLDTVMKLTVIAFWPEDNDTGKKFHKVLSELNESIRPLPQVVVITDNPTTANKSLIELIEPDYTLFEKCEHIFHDLSTNVIHRHGSKQSSYELPAADGPRPTRIDNASAATFRDSMQVLYLDNPFHTDLSDLTASEEEETLFFKGGTLSWEAYYNYGPEHFYVARDICPVIVNDIRRDFIDTCNAGDVTIYHAPGAGGTTLGQNIIWNLHELTPCVQVRSDTLVSPKKIAKQINTLHTETHLPIVVLFGGSSNDNTFDFIRRKCNDICVIFIHLKRVSAIGTNLKTHEYFLPGALSKNEAKRMGPKFIRYCGNDSEKKDQIQKLVDEVVSGQKHHLIEFGLVTFRHEFTGVGPYVSAYLEFDNQSKTLNNCRKVLGYLSLVQVFGQGIMPCQLFGTMLGKSPDYTFHYEKFPPTIKEFTVPVDSDFTRNSVRICHYLIAKEILDQFLSNGASVEKSPELNMKAKQNLKSFVLEFIEDLRIRQDQLGNISRTVFDIILQTFIYREGRSNQNQQGKGRSKFSRLIESIPSEQPFTERLQVMETLAESFPGSPSLWAHLGRAYAILRLNEREKTESYFQKAIVGCQEQYQSLVDIDEKDTVLSFVFHMYGTFYLKQIRAEIEQGHSCNESKFQDIMRNIFALAKTACKSFDDSRRLRFAGYQESLGCFGEIDVRLAICEFLKKHYRFKTIQELLEISKNIDFKSFVEESLSLVQQLFLRCYNVVDQSEIKDEFYNKIAQYNTLFRGMIPNKYLDSINLPDNIHTRWVKIAAIKLKYGNGERLGTINDITVETDIKSLISLLEQNIDDSKTANELASKTGLDHDLLDWIHVIRLANQRRLYTIEDVLVKVRWWFNLVHSPRLYLFVLLFLYAVPLDGPCNQEILREAVLLMEDKEWYPAAKTLSNPERPREWLGTEHGIRCLLPGETFKCDGRKKFINDEVARYRLRVMKGTIGSPNTYRNDGYIRMDVAGNVDVPVNVRFFPVRTKDNLVGQVYAGRRVEFTLAFTAQSGFEAYNVMTLEKFTCECCGRKIEIISTEKSRTCQCGETVEHDVCVQIRKNISWEKVFGSLNVHL